MIGVLVWLFVVSWVAIGDLAGASTPYLTPQKIPVNKAGCLSAHNAKRALHGVPGLQWDDALASGAADWALYLAKKPHIYLQHSRGPYYGENLFYAGGWPPGKLSSCAAAVTPWYKGIKYYDYNNPGFNWKAGTFTQVVWKSTTKVGVGIAAVTRHGFTYTFVVARYIPPGNMAGQYANNVPRKL